MSNRQIKPRAAGWYRDPHARQLRYWDGTEWTEIVSPLTSPFTAVLAFLVGGAKPDQSDIRLELTTEDMRDLAAGHTIKSPLHGGSQIIVAAPDGIAAPAEEE